MLAWKYGEGKQTCLVLNAKMALFLVDFMGLLTKLWDVGGEGYQEILDMQQVSAFSTSLSIFFLSSHYSSKEESFTNFEGEGQQSGLHNTTGSFLHVG